MFDTPTSIKVPDVRVCELDSWSIWCFDGRWLPNCVVSEVRVYCNSISFEIFYIVPDFESSIASICVVGLCDIVWQLRLVEVDFTIVAVPLDEISEIMLGEKTISFHVVCIDLESILNIIFAAVNATTDVMVSSP